MKSHKELLLLLDRKGSIPVGIRNIREQRLEYNTREQRLDTITTREQRHELSRVDICPSRSRVSYSQNKLEHTPTHGGLL